MSTDQSMTSMLESFTTSYQHIHMVSGNSSNPQVTPTSVYYQPVGKPPYPPPRGQPIVGVQSFTRTYGRIPQPSLVQLTINKPLIGTPYPSINTILNPFFNQKYGPGAPQVPLYQPIQHTQQTIP